MKKFFKWVLYIFGGLFTIAIMCLLFGCKQINKDINPISSTTKIIVEDNKMQRKWTINDAKEINEIVFIVDLELEDIYIEWD